MLLYFEYIYIFQILFKVTDEIFIIMSEERLHLGMNIFLKLLK